MKGDYFRYLAEFEKEGRDKVSEESLNAYKSASGASGLGYLNGVALLVQPKVATWPC